MARSKLRALPVVVVLMLVVIVSAALLFREANYHRYVRSRWVSSGRGGEDAVPGAGPT